MARSQTAQTLEDVIALKKKYGQPILVEIEVERLLETSGKAHAVTQNPRASMIGAPIAKFGARKSRKSSAISSLAVFHLIRWFPWNRRTTDTSVLGERSVANFGDYPILDTRVAGYAAPTGVCLSVFCRVIYISLQTEMIAGLTSLNTAEDMQRGVRRISWA